MILKKREILFHCIAIVLCILLLPVITVASKKAPLLRVAVISDLNHSYGTVGYI